VDVPQIEADADSQVISHYQPFSDFEVVLPSKKENRAATKSEAIWNYH
jgi:hypothetical protein